MVRFSYKGRCNYMNVHVSRHLIQELACTIDKWLQVISTTVLFKTVTVYTSRNLKHFKLKTILYALLCGLSNVL